MSATGGADGSRTAPTAGKKDGTGTMVLAEMVAEMAKLAHMTADGLRTDETLYAATFLAGFTDGTDGRTDGLPTDEMPSVRAVRRCPRRVADMGGDGGGAGTAADGLPTAFFSRPPFPERARGRDVKREIWGAPKRAIFMPVLHDGELPR